MKKIEPKHWKIKYFKDENLSNILLFKIREGIKNINVISILTHIINQFILFNPSKTPSPIKRLDKYKK